MRRLRRIALVLFAILLAAFTYRVLGVYEFRSGECSAAEPRKFVSDYPRHLRVMSFNIEGHATLLDGDHIVEVADTIRKYQPDIVGINEAHRHTWQARFGDHTAELARRTGMNVAFGRSYRFAGGDFGNAVLTRGQIVSTTVHQLPGTGEPRTVLESLIRVNGGIVQFYVTHTAAWASMSRDTRAAQLRCIDAHVQTSAHPYILTGDLNAPPESPEMVAFLSANTLKFAGDPREPSHRIMEQRLDYILTDPGWRVQSARVLDDGPSDHRPVLAELVHP
jgi:endonuclease/exonuclease/phosphatase family metal-dependent hydrolase